MEKKKAGSMVARSEKEKVVSKGATLDWKLVVYLVKRWAVMRAGQLEVQMADVRVER